MTTYPYCQVCIAIILREDGNFLERNPARAIDMVHGVTVCGQHIDIEVVRTAGNPILADILAERRAQDDEWGGPRHDDEHPLEDWLVFLRRQFDRATQAVSAEDVDAYRGRLVKIAALAVAALESHDRKRAHV